MTGGLICPHCGATYGAITEQKGCWLRLEVDVWTAHKGGGQSVAREELYGWVHESQVDRVLNIERRIHGQRCLVAALPEIGRKQKLGFRAWLRQLTQRMA